jgi:hypothetical protein
MHQINGLGVVRKPRYRAGRGRAGGFLPLARLTLRHVDPSNDDIAFDPTVHSHPEVELVPHWLNDLRRAAYRLSRAGRDAG